jgi:hypothetical protein
MAEKEKVTVKDQHDEHQDYYSTLSDGLKGFLDEVYLLDDGKYKAIRLTSGKRSGDEDSHHHTGDAVDIAAWGDGGAEGNELYSRLMNSSDGLALLNKYNLGIYDETNPENLAKTGGDAPHFHIGRDEGLFNNTANRLGTFADGNAEVLTSFFSKNPSFDYSNIGKGTSAGATTSSATGRIEGPTSFEIISGDPNDARTFVQDVEKEKEKSDKTDKKVSESDARKRIEKVKLERFKAEQAKKQAFIKTLSEIAASEAPREPRRQKAFREQKFDAIPMQTSLPSLPSIHQLPKEFEDGGLAEFEGDPVLTPKQRRQQKYYQILDNIRGGYKHLDKDTRKWVNQGELNFGGKSIVKGFEDKPGANKITTSDFVTWKVDGHNFTPDPTSFVDIGVSGLDRDNFDTDEDYKTAYDLDRVVLAPRDHPKYGKMYMPIGTGKSSQKLTERFGQNFSSFKQKKSAFNSDQIIPYYQVNDEEKYGQGYADYRKKQLGVFGEVVEEKKYGGEINSDSYIDLELTDEEIKKYEQGGYKIEYL